MLVCKQHDDAAAPPQSAQLMLQAASVSAVRPSQRNGSRAAWFLRALLTTVRSSRVSCASCAISAQHHRVLCAWKMRAGRTRTDGRRSRRLRVSFTARSRQLGRRMFPAIDAQYERIEDIVAPMHSRMFTMCSHTDGVDGRQRAKKTAKEPRRRTGAQRPGQRNERLHRRPADRRLYRQPLARRRRT